MTIQRILLRGGTAAQWATADPILMEREPGIELTGTGSKIKIGDGVTAWSSLPYLDTGAIGALSLDDLSDVIITSPTSGDLLHFNGTDFVNVSVLTALTGVLDTDGTFAADSDSKIASQKATKTYADTLVAGVEYEATFGFASASTTWTISHGRGTKALSVETFNASGGRMLGEIEYTDLNTITISWYYPTSGSARVFS